MIRATVLLLVLILLPGCSISEPYFALHHHRVGLGGNHIGQEEATQYYTLFGLVRWNDVKVQRVVGDYSSYDIFSGVTLGDFFFNLLLFPIASKRSVILKY